jgi:hypothetical protein
MENYFNQNLLYAIAIAAAVWIGVFILGIAARAGSMGVFLIVGLFVITILLFIGLISS